MRHIRVLKEIDMLDKIIQQILYSRLWGGKWSIYTKLFLAFVFSSSLFSNPVRADSFSVNYYYLPVGATVLNTRPNTYRMKIFANDRTGNYSSFIAATPTNNSTITQANIVAVLKGRIRVFYNTNSNYQSSNCASIYHGSNGAMCSRLTMVANAQTTNVHKVNLLYQLFINNLPAFTALENQSRRIAVCIATGCLSGGLEIGRAHV